MSETPEGWQAEKYQAQRIYHYIVGTFSLCRKLGLYTGELMPDTPRETRQRRLQGVHQEIGRSQGDY